MHDQVPSQNLFFAWKLKFEKAWAIELSKYSTNIWHWTAEDSPVVYAGFRMQEMVPLAGWHCAEAVGWEKNKSSAASTAVA